MRRDDLVDVLIIAIYPDCNTHASCRVVYHLTSLYSCRRLLGTDLGVLLYGDLVVGLER
jgi:hypothetical protein